MARGSLAVIIYKLNIKKPNNKIITHVTFLPDIDCNAQNQSLLSSQLCALLELSMTQWRRMVLPRISHYMLDEILIDAQKFMTDLLFVYLSVHPFIFLTVSLRTEQTLFHLTVCESHVQTHSCAQVHEHKSNFLLFITSKDKGIHLSTYQFLQLSI